MLQTNLQLPPPLPLTHRLCGQAHLNVSFNTSTSFGPDTECAMAEDSKVSGDSGTSCTPQPVCSLTTSKTTTSTNNYVNPTIPQSRGSIKRVTGESRVTPREPDQAYISVGNQSLDKNGTQYGDMSGECNTDGYKSRNSQGQIGRGSNNWNGWMPPTYNPEASWKQCAGHPQQFSGRAIYQHGSAGHFPTPPMTSQSWTPIGWPLVLPHSQHHGLRNSHNFGHNMDQAMLLPHTSYYPQNSSVITGGHNVPFTQSQQVPMSQQIEHGWKAAQSRTNACQTRNGNSILSNTSQGNSSSSSSSVTSQGSKTSSSLGTISPVMSRKPHVASHTDYVVDQMSLPYINQQLQQNHQHDVQQQHQQQQQQHMIVMPCYQYGGSMTPYYSWTAPVMMQLSVAQPPVPPLPPQPQPQPPVPSTPTNSVSTTPQMKGPGTCLPHTTLTFTPHSERHGHSISQGAVPARRRDVHSPANKPGRGGYMTSNYNRNSSFNNRPVNSPPPYNSSPEILSRQQTGRKVEQSKTPDFPVVFSSAATRRITVSPGKFPRPANPGHSHSAPPIKGFGNGASGGLISTLKSTDLEQLGTLSPITPPPTPLPNIEEMAGDVSDLTSTS